MVYRSLAPYYLGKFQPRPCCLLPVQNIVRHMNAKMTQQRAVRTSGGSEVLSRAHLQIDKAFHRNRKVKPGGQRNLWLRERWVLFTFEGMGEREKWAHRVVSLSYLLTNGRERGREGRKEGNRGRVREGFSNDGLRRVLALNVEFPSFSFQVRHVFTFFPAGSPQYLQDLHARQFYPKNTIDR